MDAFPSFFSFPCPPPSPSSARLTSTLRMDIFCACLSVCQGCVLRRPRARFPAVPRGLPGRDSAVDVSPGPRQRHHGGGANPVHVLQGLQLQGAGGQPSTIRQVQCLMCTVECSFHVRCVHFCEVLQSSPAHSGCGCSVYRYPHPASPRVAPVVSLVASLVVLI